MLGNANPPQSSAAEALFGRGRELELIGSFLDRAGTQGEALVVFGDPGVGKTALLNAAANAASEAGARVLRAAGVEFEAGMTYSGLNQALLPLFEEFGQLSDMYRDALNVALGFGEGAAPDRFVVSNATLTVLRRAAAACPLLVIVDDLPWLDRASAVVLGFVARRLAGSRVGILVASRTGEESFFDRAGLPEYELAPLDEEAASCLLSARFPGMAGPVHQRVLAAAEGNPLALLEIPPALSGAQRDALAALPPLLPLSRRLQALFASRVTELPAPTRKLLLLMALDGTGDVRVLQASGARGLEELVAAERGQLVHFDASTHRLAFRHPLIRSTVVELSSGDERRRAYRALADVLVGQPDRHAWHLAEAAVEPDERAAESLELMALRILRRGDGVGAVSALTRAADLSPRGGDRGRRLAEAAYIGADVTGELRNASQLLADAHRADPQFTGSLQAAVTAAFVLLNGDGNVETAHRLLVGAIESTSEVSETVLEEALHVLALLCFFGGRAELWAPFNAVLELLEPSLPRTVYLLSTCFADPLYRAAPALPQLDQAIAELATEADPTVILKVGFAAGNVDRLSECRDAFQRVARDGRETGAIGSLIQALVLLAFETWQAGEWDETLGLAEEAVGLCDVHGFPLFAFSVRHAQAAVSAARGDDAVVDALVDAMVRWAAPRGAGFVDPVSCHIRALAALGKGEFEQAYQLASAISPAGTLPARELMVQWVVMDIVEAAAHTGRMAEAASHVAVLREVGVAAISSRLALLAAGAAAIAAADAEVVQLFDAALATPPAGRWPFYRARVELAYGERLRRLRATAESRVHLSGALETFERLGAKPWADRATRELRATGQTRPTADQRDRDALTPQELEIATLAAAGLSNKQIGQRLFLSHRTVGAHLYRIFPKLGITSRAALRDALASLSPEDHG